MVASAGSESNREGEQWRSVNAFTRSRLRSALASQLGAQLRAETVRGYRGTVTALPIDSTVAILKRHGALRP